MKKQKTCIEIVRSYLKRYGYSGLYNPQANCGCEIDDLVPCGENFESCIPGYKYKCNCTKEEHYWHISPYKDKSKRIKDFYIF